MALNLTIYKKGESTAAFTGVKTTADITGLAAGTVVATGDYEATNVDPDGLLTESGRVPVEGWTVPKQQAPTPANLKVTPTADGATITEDEPTA
ncbi:hypothetical protein [Levilactobacillus sp. HBUAS70063]|uniref:hypothetical protein n=1 Tax=Levilactobacillus sp. HBUAS70063 TaxID=3109359 RepID=UPI00313347A3